MQAVIGANMLGQLLDLQERRDLGMMQLVPRSLCVHAGQQVGLTNEKKRRGGAVGWLGGGGAGGSVRLGALAACEASSSRLAMSMLCPTCDV